MRYLSFQPHPTLPLPLPFPLPLLTPYLLLSTSSSSFRLFLPFLLALFLLLPFLLLFLFLPFDVADMQPDRQTNTGRDRDRSHDDSRPAYFRAKSACCHSKHEGIPCTGEIAT